MSKSVLDKCVKGRGKGGSWGNPTFPTEGRQLNGTGLLMVPSEWLPLLLHPGWQNSPPAGRAQTQAVIYSGHKLFQCILFLNLASVHIYKQMR